MAVESLETDPDRRTKTVKVRFSPEELATARHLCPRAELARWLREMALNPTADWVQQQRVPARSAPDPELLRHVAGIGNNVNQIARRVNATQGPLDAIPILAALTDISAQLQQLIDAR